jgi:hypothetical protein
VEDLKQINTDAIEYISLLSGKTITNSLLENKAVMDSGKWEAVTKFITENYSRIITLRGAGTNNGMDKTSADQLMETQLLPRLKDELENGNVAIMFDGDQDDLEKPDIGYIMGRLRDSFKEDPSKLLFATAQKKSWYYPATEGSNLGTAHNQPYFTYVFEDGAYDGDHNSFTQSKQFVESTGYEQWYIGASGDIANEQLADYEHKVEEGQKRKALIFKAPINKTLDTLFEQKLKDAEASSGQAKIEKFTKVLEQRKNVYGVHWNNDGTPKINKEQYKKLDFEFVG